MAMKLLKVNFWQNWIFIFTYYNAEHDWNGLNGINCLKFLNQHIFGTVNQLIIDKFMEEFCQLSLHANVIPKHGNLQCLWENIFPLTHNRGITPDLIRAWGSWYHKKEYRVNRVKIDKLNSSKIDHNKIVCKY